MSNFHNPSSESIKRSGKAPERSNFVNTCNLLSKYLKEKGGFKNLNPEIVEKLNFRGIPESSKAKANTTKDFLSTIEDLNKPPTEQELDLPKFGHMAFSGDPQNSTNKLTVSRDATMEPKTEKMTILYQGKVWVFDGLSPENAGEVMLLASKGSSCWSRRNMPTASPNKITHVGPIASNSTAPSSSGKQQLDANTSDLPIARRSSLHRFLAKRKDRATAIGPYQMQNARGSSSKSDNEQLDLNF